MIRALRWIWEQVCALGNLVAGLVSSVWTWLVAFLAWLVDEVSTLVADAFDYVFPSIEWPSLVTDGSSLFGACVHYFALDVAIQSLAALFLAWMLARVARLVMVPIRAFLELL